jgi:surface antigen
MRFRKVTSVIAIGLMATMPIIVGCETIERETGLGKKTQIGAAGGAATGGIIAALAGANPAWIAAAVILGAVAGGVIGNQLDKKDKEKYASSGYEAISTMGKGGKTSWRNPETGNSGTTTINDVFTKADGTRCKRFTQTLTTSGKTHTTNGVACKEGDAWKVVNI